MSSIASVGSQSSLYQLLQSSRQGNAAPPGTSGFPEPPAQLKAQLQQKAQAAGIDLQKLDSLKPQIQEAAAGALESTQGASQQEQFAAVQDAVGTVLKDNGIDPEQLKKQFESLAAGGPPGAFGGGSFSVRGYQSSSESSSADLIAKLLEQLQSTDSAKGTADTSSLDLASLFKNAPSGFAIDTAA